MIRTAVAAAIVIAAVLFSAATYVVSEQQQAVITRFNKPVGVIVGDTVEAGIDELREDIIGSAKRKDEEGEEIEADDIFVKQGAGLYFKVPFIDSVEYIPDVILEYDAEPREILLADKKKLNVDNFARWHVRDPLLYRVTVRTERNARDRLDDVIYSAVREELGQNPLTEVIRTTNRFVDRPSAIEEAMEDIPGATEEAEDESGETGLSDNPMQTHIDQGREEIMKAVTAASDAKARQYGISIIDVRIKRADLLPENLEAVFGRMQAERSRISRGYRSEGQKQADIIEGTTDRRVQIIIAEAERDAQELRGEGDARAIEIFANAFGTNHELYEFFRSLEVLGDNTSKGGELILGVDSSLYRYLKPPEELQ
jgi:membrane protease subunit HflC